MNKLENVSGTIKSIRYTNERTGYTVCDLKTEKSVVTLVGSMPLLAPGENVTATGDFVVHSEYGRQFKVASCERKIPTREEEMQDYLSGGMIKGLGPATAKRIIETFRDKAFEVLLSEPMRLTEIRGITSEKALSFGQAFLKHENMRNTIMLMYRYNVSTNYAIKIWKRFGSQAGEEIRKNPYILTENDIGLSFSVCDRIAFLEGIEPGDKERLKAALLWILRLSVGNGHTYFPKEQLLARGAKLTRVVPGLVEDAFDALFMESEIFVERQYPDRVYTPELIEAERFCARRLVSLNGKKDDFSAGESDDLLRQYEGNHHIQMDEIQKKAVLCALENGVSIITGGPGTGKTTIIKVLIHVFEAYGLSVTLAAPTGRAAKRISETSGCEAKTIHRLLEVGYNIDDQERPYFMRNEENPLSFDVLIVDEASMIDIVMMDALLKAFPPDARLILVGDVDQLPSVGAGNVLSDIIDSNTIKTIRLDAIFRQSAGSIIVQNAHLINNGQMPVYNKKDTDFFFMRENKTADIVNLIIDLYSLRLPVKYNLNPVKDIQVLSPMKKGDAGVIELNKRLQSAINPPSRLKKEKGFGKYIFREGDKVMQVKNNYQTEWKTIQDGNTVTGEGIYNGDMGYIVFIDETEQEITVKFDEEKEVIYPFSQLDELILAYATTVHKSQGSEFPVVIMPVVWGPPMLLTRNLFYTAITRARQLVVLVGTERYMQDMINNDKIDRRYSALNYRLSSAFATYRLLSEGIIEI